MKPTPQFGGQVRPPADLWGAAQKSMTPAQFDQFIAQHGESFTPDQLAAFVTEMRYGTRN